MIEHEFGYPEVTLYDTALRRMSSCRSVHLVRTLPGSLGVDRLCEHGGSGAEATLVFAGKPGVRGLAPLHLHCLFKLG